MNIYKEHLNVPLHLCEFTIQNNFVAELRLYLYLKKESSGQVRLSSSQKEEIAITLSCTERSFRTHLKNLRTRNWIGFNKKSGYYFIRGFERIKAIEGLTGRKGCWLEINTKEIWSDKKKFKAFIVSALIGHLSRTSRWKEQLKKYGDKAVRPDRHKGRSNPSRAASSSGFFPVAAQAIFDIYNIPVSTASDYKRLAEKYKFLKIKKSYKDIPVSLEQLGNYKKSIAYEDAKKLKVFYDKKSGERKVVSQEPDLVLPLLEYSKRYRSKKGVC